MQILLSIHFGVLKQRIPCLLCWGMVVQVTDAKHLVCMCVSTFLGNASSFYWCPVPILGSHWASSAHGSHCCHLPWRPCTVHDSDSRPPLPHRDWPAPQHHCNRSELPVCHFVLVLSKAYYIMSDETAMGVHSFQVCPLFSFFFFLNECFTHNI